MGKTIFHDLYELSRWMSTYLPLSSGVPLDQEVGGVVTVPGAKIPEGEHWAVVSKTGNGKTTCVKAICRGYRQKYPWINTYILDSKKQGDFSSADGKIYNSYEPPPLLTGIGQRQVWQPVVDNIDAYDSYFQRILDAGKPALVIIDESKNLKFGTKAPKGYELITSQGRKPGIFVLTNYQEVANGLRQGFSQSTHIICFSVWNSYDERAMKSYLRLPLHEPLPLKGKHSFLYLNKDKMGSPQLFSGYQDFLSYFMNW